MRVLGSPASPSAVTRRVLPPVARRWLNDRWLVRWARLWLRNTLVLRPALKHQLAWAGSPASVRSSQARILVPLLQTTHYQYYQILALAKALQLRGAAVRVLICDSVLDGCELKNSRRRDRDPCLTCRHNARDLVGLFGLDTVRLSDIVKEDQKRRLSEEAAWLSSEYPTKYEYKGVEIIGMTNDSVTRHYYGAVPGGNSRELRATRRRYLYSALVGIDVAEQVERDWCPTALMNDMAVYADWGPYSQYFSRHGVPYNLVSMAPYNMNAVMLNYQQLYTGTDRFDRWRAQRHHEFLDQVEQQVLEAFINERFATGGGFEQKFGWFASNGVDFQPDVAGKRNVFLFSNLAWDVGINYEGGLYQDVVEWVLDSIEILAAKPESHLYVKTHPEESYGSAPSEQGVAAAIRRRFGEIPSTVTIIPPELKVRTYDLFPMIDLGVVYNSTVGLEMLLKGVPVVVAGAAPYSGHGLALEPRTKAEYGDVLLGRIKPPSPDARLVELCAYFYFIKSQIPWRLTQQVYFDDFRGFTFNCLDDLLPGKDPYLDHLCGCILEPDRTVVEAWT